MQHAMGRRVVRATAGQRGPNASLGEHLKKGDASIPRLLALKGDGIPPFYSHLSDRGDLSVQQGIVS